MSEISVKEYRRMTALQRWFFNIEITDKCWIWKAHVETTGYGQLRVNGLNTMAHRFGYEMLVGKIPSNLVCDHLCRNRKCVNPKHIELVTGRENTLRGDTLASKESKQTHCVQGHIFDHKNTYIRTMKNGSKKRQCRTCRNISVKKYLTIKKQT